jgi:cytidylate kinase
MRIAVDGPLASGKGTIARALAARFGLPHMDTGALYRAVAVALLEAGENPADAAAAEAAARALDPDAIDEQKIRSAGAGAAASIVSAHSGVRRALREVQEAFAARPGGAVLDGRDIGTVICPGAEVKLFVTASEEARAWRRHAELINRGEDGVASGRRLALAFEGQGHETIPGEPKQGHDGQDEDGDQQLHQGHPAAQP